MRKVLILPPLFTGLSLQCLVAELVIASLETLLTLLVITSLLDRCDKLVKSLILIAAAFFNNTKYHVSVPPALNIQKI
jgi:hypothetical protein